MSIDEREDPDDEEEVVADGVPIVASNEIIDSYGDNFEFYVDEHDVPAVRSAGQENQASSINSC